MTLGFALYIMLVLSAWIWGWPVVLGVVLGVALDLYCALPIRQGGEA